MRARFLLAIALFVLAGCSRPAAETSPIGLPMETIVIDTDHGPATFQVEIAADNASRERGLMFRKTMEPDHGMLFDFKVTEGVAFWMKNTILPLDMLFVRADGTIASISEDAVPYSLDVISSDEPVRAVIELNAGRAYYMDIEPGDRVHASVFPPS